MVKRSGQQLPGECMYCTGNFRGENNSILVVDDQRGIIGYIFFVCFGHGRNCIYNDFSDTRGILGLKMRVFEA